MPLKEQLDADLKAAMRAKDEVKLSVVRMLKSAIKYREIELMKPLDDAGVIGVISSEIKRRKDSVEQYRAGNRADLAEKEEAEIRVLQGWLPAQLTADELKALVEAAVEKSGAQGPKDMGAVMKLLMPDTQGKADGKVVSDMVKARLSGK
ncbi:MAG TPA: GatB/YqeY domain-containing protein [Anaeromyxobacteraceae bacterium]|nr:GatB/YqeY domain-containing protein [Anaeromyxobacteraceae bacterium]